MGNIVLLCIRGCLILRSRASLSLLLGSLASELDPEMKIYDVAYLSEFHIRFFIGLSGISTFLFHFHYMVLSITQHVKILIFFQSFSQIIIENF